MSIVPLESGWRTLNENGIRVLEEYLDTGKTREVAGGSSNSSAAAAGDARKCAIFTRAEYSEMYTTVYNMCTQRTPNNWSEQLYKRYGESISKYVKEKILPALKQREDVYLLQELLKRWENHKMYIKWMDRFFTYLDRYYVKLQSVEPLHQRGISIFYQLVFEEVKKDVRNAILACINRERTGDKIDQELIKGVIDMYIGLGNGSLDVYTREFEEQFLPASQEHFTRQSSGWISEDSFPEYLRKVEEALKSEEDRVNRYLHRSTNVKLKSVVIQALLAQPQMRLLEKETSLSFLLSNDKTEDMTRMHRLFSLVEDGLAPVAKQFCEYVKGRGTAVVDEKVEQLKNATKADVSDPSFIQSMLDLHDKHKSTVTECFGSDSIFQKALKEAFETFINQEVGKYSFAQLMSTFCDRILRKSGDKLSEEQVETSLNKIVELFSYLTDKDLFADIYRNQLAKRLLYETSASDDAERSMIAKLKLKCGAQFTSKLEGMITDLSLAAETQREFQDHCNQLNDKNAALGGIDFQVQVLTTGYWPSYQTHDVTLAPEMQKAMGVFHTFYAVKTQHRRLTWIHTLGSAVVSAHLQKRHDLITNSYQACILLLFKTHETLSFEMITKLLKIDESFAKKLVATLSFGKFKILVKADPDNSDQKSISAEDVFKPNDNFQCPHRKLKIPAPTFEETHNRERVEEDRSIAIEAAIVRIMKARKTLGHQQLVTEVLQQLSFFRPNPKVVKQRIEHLIEREYLERGEQANQYRYLA
mmetsp:Transcript_20406/g.49633  ORF Transcript_20406/g.49633 Transcript_20406/m.49633 type:complete len:758 (-) Transcript_20406:1630-3903(-)